MSKIQESTQVWQAVLLPMSLVTHSRLTLPQAKNRLPPLVWAQHAAVIHAGAMWGVLYTHPFKSTHTRILWKNQSVERESCPTAGSLPDEEGLPPHPPLQWPELQPGWRQWRCPWKKPFIIPCSQTTFHGYQARIRLFYSVDGHSVCTDIKYYLSLWGKL